MFWLSLSVKWAGHAGQAPWLTIAIAAIVQLSFPWILIGCKSWIRSRARQQS